MNRAELYALYLGGTAVTNAHTFAYTDSSYSLKHFDSAVSTEQELSGDNSDILQGARDGEVQHVTPIKVVAHAETKTTTLAQLRETVEWVPFCLNALADAVADAHAAKSEPKHHAAMWNLWDDRITAIALRISRLEMEARSQQAEALRVLKAQLDYNEKMDYGVTLGGAVLITNQLLFLSLLDLWTPN